MPGDEEINRAMKMLFVRFRCSGLMAIGALDKYRFVTVNTSSQGKWYVNW